MNWTRELNFTINDVQGQLKLICTPLSIKLFQEGKEIKKKGSFGGAKYDITTINGTTESLKITNNIIQGCIANFREEKINLERKLTTTEIIIAFVSVLIFALGCGLILVMGGAIGGALLGGLGVLSLLLACNFIRQENNISKQIAIAVIAGIVCYIIYFLLALFFSLIFKGLF